MAPLVHALASDPDIEAKVCVTAQHREMLNQVLTLFSIVPDYDLNIMKPGQGLTEITCRILQELKPILESFKPDVVLVHGDTTTTVATSLAAFYQRIPVGHVEAGLRTGNLYSPWPEEANRTLTGHLAMYHFAPTENSRQNLLRENIADNKIFVTGNTVIDALIWVRDRVLQTTSLRTNSLPAIHSCTTAKKPFWSPATVAKALAGVLSKSVTRWLKSRRRTTTCRLSIRSISILTSASRLTASWVISRMSF